MRFIHSFSSRPLGVSMYDTSALTRMIGNIWYFSLSVAYAKRSGAEIELHTDSFGRALLGHLPYDALYLTLDNMPDDIHPRFWAAGKIVALKEAPLGAVHIDGDVFVKRRELVTDWDRSEWDAIAQHYESSDWYRYENRLFDRDRRFALSVGLDTRSKGLACNTGVIGFRDAALKQEYIDGYLRMARHYSRFADTLENTQLTPDVMIEQLWFYQLMERRKANLKIVLDDDCPHEYAASLGFQHEITMTKFALLDKCKATLRNVNPEIYEKTLKLCRNF